MIVAVDVYKTLDRTANEKTRNPIRKQPLANRSRDPGPEFYFHEDLV